MATFIRECPHSRLKSIPQMLRLSVVFAFLILTNLMLTSVPCFAEKTSSRAEARPAPQQEESVKPGINDRFLDPELNVDEWLGRFEIESREVYGARERVLDAIGLKQGQTVADIGAGTGFYSKLFASTVGESGWVYSVDIAPSFLKHINKQAEVDGVLNLTCVLGTERSVCLPPNSVEFVFICDTYHHFEYPQSTLASIRRALKPGGTLVVIDFERIPGESREWTLGHVRAGKEVFQKEIVDSGLTFVEEVQIRHQRRSVVQRARMNSRHGSRAGRVDGTATAVLCGTICS